MREVIVERQFNTAIRYSDAISMVHDGNACLDLHNIDRHRSLLSSDGSSMLCHMSAADTESVRIAMGNDARGSCVVWSATLHDRPDLAVDEISMTNVAVERTFGQPVDIDDIQAIEDNGAWCLEAYQVKFVRTFFSVDRKKMVCLYRAPDAESVRLAQRMAKMPVDRVWAFVSIGDVKT